MSGIYEKPPQEHSAWQEHIRLVWRRTWPIIRQILGWTCIVLGILGLFLPLLQGVLFLVIGIALVGRRNWLLRWASVKIKLFVRRWAAHPHPWLSRLGLFALRGQQQLSRQRRRFAWRAMSRRTPPRDPHR